MDQESIDTQKIRVAFGHLNALRCAIVIYKQDNDGKSPSALEELAPKYLRCVPKLDIPFRYSDGKVILDSDIDWRGKTLAEY